MPGTNTGERHPEIAKAVGQRLRRARDKTGLTQQHVADHTGIHRSALSDIETGARRVDAVELVKLATLYAVSADHILGLVPLDNPTLPQVLNNLENLLVHSSRDYSRYGRDAWLYGVLVGWGCEEDHAHDLICGGDDALDEVAERHNWSDLTVDELLTHRGIIASITSGLPVRPRRTATVPARHAKNATDTA